MTYRIVLQPTAVRLLRRISDRRIQEKIRDRIDGLAHEPEKQGKPLTGELSGYRSLRAVGQRYRILYCIEKEKVLVMVLAVGIRKEGRRTDVYELARKLFKSGLF